MSLWSIEILIKYWLEQQLLKVSEKMKTNQKFLLNEAIFHVDIGMERLVVVHNPAAFDQKPVALKEGQRKEETKIDEWLGCSLA